MKKITILFLVLSMAFTVEAQIVSIPDTNLKHILTMDNCVDLDDDGTGDSNADTNNDGEIQVSEAEAVEYLILNSADPGIFTILDLTGLQAFVNLKSLNASAMSLSETQNVGGMNQNVGVETIDLTPFTSLERFRIGGDTSSILNDINASGLTNLIEFSAVAFVSSNNEGGTVPVSIDFQNCDNLTSINVTFTFFDIDFCQIPSLESLNCVGITPYNSDLDLNCLINLNTLDVSLNNFDSLYLKNGSVLDSFSGFDTYGETLCIDDNQAEIDSLGDTINNFQNVTSTCEDTEGTNVVIGTVSSSISSNNDDCTINEVINPLRFDVLQNNMSIYDFLSTEADEYETPFGLGQGDYVLVPTVAFTNGLVVEPEEINVSFADNNGEMVQQDVCMVPRVEVVDGIEIEFFPNYVPDDPFLDRFDAYIILTNTNTTDYTGELRLEFDGDYTAPFDYDYMPSSELDNEVIWDNVTITANGGRRVFWLRIGYNSDSDPEFPVMEGDQLIYDLFLTDTGSGSRSTNGVSDFRLIQTIDPNPETLSNANLNTEDSEIEMYPNPTNGIISIEHAETINEVAIFSINGQSVQSKIHLSNNSGRLDLDMTSLARGVYFITVKTSSQVVTKKIIKQ